MKDIYVIATMRDSRDNLFPIGWEETEEAARGIVEGINDEYVADGCGRPLYIVVEQISQGVPPSIKNQIWYKLECGRYYVGFIGLRNTGVFISNADSEQTF